MVFTNMVKLMHNGHREVAAIKDGLFTEVEKYVFVGPNRTHHLIIKSIETGSCRCYICRYMYNHVYMIQIIS